MTSGLILADIFLNEDAKKILLNKSVVIIGDSGKIYTRAKFGLIRIFKRVFSDLKKSCTGHV